MHAVMEVVFNPEEKRKKEYVIYQFREEEIFHFYSIKIIFNR
jgi:hypothetical protein